MKRAEKNARQAALKEAETERQRAEMDELERVKAEKEEADQRVVEAQADRDRVLVDAEAKVAILAAGVPAERLAKALRLLDLDGIEVEDGRIDAASVRRAVEALKAEIPELFAVPGPARSGGDFTVASEGKRSFTAAEVKAMSAAEYSEPARRDHGGDAGGALQRVRPRDGLSGRPREHLGRSARQRRRCCTTRPAILDGRWQSPCRGRWARQRCPAFAGEGSQPLGILWSLGQRS